MHFFFFTLVCKNVLYILCASREKKINFFFFFPFTNVVCGGFGGWGRITLAMGNDGVEREG